MADTLGDRARTRTASSFAGRDRILPLVEAFLDEGSDANILYLHGAAGSGKSAVIRELLAHPSAKRYELQSFDGRQLPPAPEALDAAMALWTGSEPQLLVIDTYEIVDSLGGHLRDHVLPSLDGDARVVLASRRSPEPEWFQSDLASVFKTLAMEPLPPTDARAMLMARGVSDEDQCESIIDWAEGLPLALVLAATAAAIGSRPLDLEDLSRSLLDQVSGEELQGADRDVLTVAAIAPAVDARLLEAVLPDVDGASAEAWVRQLSFAESIGRRVTLHDRVRNLLQAEVARNEPEFDRMLRFRLVDHLTERAITTEPHLLADLRQLADGDDGTGEFMRDALNKFRLDRVRPTDADAVSAAYGNLSAWPYAQRLLRWMKEAPHHVIVVREGERLAGMALWATPRIQPTLSSPDPVVDAWLAHARSLAPDGNVVFLFDALRFCSEDEDFIRVLAVGNIAMQVRAGIANLRWAYLAHDSHEPGSESGRLAEAQVMAFGGERHPELDVDDGDCRFVGYLVDYGHAGVIGATRDRLHDLIARRHAPVPPQMDGEDITLEVVRRALRNLHRPLSLASSPLADGTDPLERAATADRVIREAVAGAFGVAGEDRDLRATLESGYLDPAGGHAHAMRTLHFSRTTYYRHLRTATERVAAHLRSTTTPPPS